MAVATYWGIATSGVEGGAGFTPPPPPPPPDVPPPEGILDTIFPTNSWLRQTLPTTRTPNPGSAVAVGVILDALAAGTPWVQAENWTTSITYAPPSTPMVPVTLVGNFASQSWAETLKMTLASGVPIPADTIPSNDSDAAMVVVQPEWGGGRGRMYEMWVVESPAQNGLGHWTCQYGSRMTGTTSRAIGRYTSKWWENQLPGAWGPDGDGEEDFWGSQASKVPYSHTVIRHDDLERGRIDHPIGFLIGWHGGIFSGPVWPANGADSSSTTEMPQGSRLALPANWVPNPAAPAIQRWIETCMRDHGLIFTDTSGGNLAIRGEPGTGAYFDAFGPGGREALMDALPWSSLELLSVGNDSNFNP